MGYLRELDPVPARWATRSWVSVGGIFTLSCVGNAGAIPTMKLRTAIASASTHARHPFRRQRAEVRLPLRPGRDPKEHSVPGLPWRRQCGSLPHEAWPATDAQLDAIAIVNTVTLTGACTARHSSGAPCNRRHHLVAFFDGQRPTHRMRKAGARCCRWRAAGPGTARAAPETFGLDWLRVSSAPRPRCAWRCSRSSRRHSRTRFGFVGTTADTTVAVLHGSCRQDRPTGCRAGWRTSSPPTERMLERATRTRIRSSW